MPETVVQYNLAHALTKAFRNGNVLANAFQSLDVLPSVPSSAAAPRAGGDPSTDGVWPVGRGGIMAPRRVFVVPYCEGAPGSAFSMRLYGWKVLSHPEGGTQRAVAIPLLLCELACVACNRPGPASAVPGSASVRLLRETENLCDTIALTQGALGQDGYLNATGQPGVPTDLIAFALVDLIGCDSLSFDFAGPADAVNQIGMNALWAIA